MFEQINQSVQIESSSARILTVWLDSPNRSVNVFDADMISGLEAVVDHVRSLSDRYLAVLFRSRKPSGFFAGADVHALATMTSAEDVRMVLERGQKLMQQVEELPLPTVAAIDGVCMGGGLEFALACRVRLASDSPSTKLGLPEIRLGVIPGWGGTQRLPKLIGVQKALQMILKGNAIPAAKALSCGLIDGLIEHAAWEEQLQQKVARVAQGMMLHSKRRSTWSTQLLEHSWLGRAILFRAARRQIASQAVHYPATVEAIGAVSRAGMAGSEGFKFERQAFERLLFSSTARSLLGLFLQRDRAKKVKTWIDADWESEAGHFSNVLVVGAGAMGAGIGVLAASQGYHVTFKEVTDDSLKAGRERVFNLLSEQVERQRLSAEKRDEVFQRISFTTDWEHLSENDLAIEAVLEVEQVKRDVFAKLSQRLPWHAVLASNTSSLSVTRMASATARLGQVAGLHFFNPVDRMELVEVVRTEASDVETIKRLLEFVRSLGKTPIVTSDKPGFLVNRVLFPYLGEAVRMVSEGHLVKEVDQELRRFGMPMGPLELLDQVGIDIASHVAQSLAAVQPDAAIPAKFLAEMAGKGWLGKKSNLGFYDYRQTKHVRSNALLLRSIRPDQPTHAFLDDGLTSTQRRLVYAMLNEAVHCLDEQVVAEPWMVDLGMVLGTGFAPMHGGPLRLIDHLGINTVQHNLVGLTQLYGERFVPADGIVRMARSKGEFLAGKSESVPATVSPIAM